MEAEVEEKGDVVVVRVKGRLDAASSPQLEKKIFSIIDAGHFKLVLNLAGVEYLSSAGMRLMLAVSKKLKHLEGKVVACGLNDEVMEMIKMAGFHQVLELYPSEEESFSHV
ncbi:MAG: putative anti-sigma factor antagonist BtrV [Chlamydiae bacterium]|nr:putative anti-sigma factor antagonist BtrV [Chlamydiota bacterium]